nr:hypothetical protein [Candidatus Sigynarchaeum springense]
MKPLNIIIEKHPDGYVAYPLGIIDVIVGEGSIHKKALTDVKSVIQFHIESFGSKIFEGEDILETFIAAVAL